MKESRLGYNLFLQYEYNGVINKIGEGQRGCPIVYFKDTTIRLDIDEIMIHDKILIGDSIISGTKKTAFY